MPKHKKTREQKMRADERKSSLPATSQSHITPSYTFSLSSAHQPSHVDNTTKTIHVDKLLHHDLLKTAIVSFVILFLQLALFVLLKNHVLAFSFVRY